MNHLKYDTSCSRRLVNQGAVISIVILIICSNSNSCNMSGALLSGAFNDSIFTNSVQANSSVVNNNSYSNNSNNDDDDNDDNDDDYVPVALIANAASDTPPNDFAHQPSNLINDELLQQLQFLWSGENQLVFAFAVLVVLKCFLAYVDIVLIAVFFRLILQFIHKMMNEKFSSMRFLMTRSKAANKSSVWNIAASIQSNLRYQLLLLGVAFMLLFACLNWTVSCYEVNLISRICLFSDGYYYSEEEIADQIQNNSIAIAVSNSTNNSINQLQNLRGVLDKHYNMQLLFIFWIVHMTDLGLIILGDLIKIAWWLYYLEMCNNNRSSSNNNNSNNSNNRNSIRNSNNNSRGLRSSSRGITATSLAKKEGDPLIGRKNDEYNDNNNYDEDDDKDGEDSGGGDGKAIPVAAIARAFYSIDSFTTWHRSILPILSWLKYLESGIAPAILLCAAYIMMKIFDSGTYYVQAREIIKFCHQSEIPTFGIRPSSTTRIEEAISTTSSSSLDAELEAGLGLGLEGRSQNEIESESECRIICPLCCAETAPTAAIQLPCCKIIACEDCIHRKLYRNNACFACKSLDLQVNCEHLKETFQRKSLYFWY